MVELRGANEAVAGAAASAEKPLEFGKRYTWLGLGLLLGVSTVNLIDRSVINLLLVPIGQDLHLKDWQLGVFTGPAFGIFYALSQIPIARLADRTRRVAIIASALAFWSAMTMVQAAALGFLTLAMARAAVAIGESGSGPASQSMIADLFPVSQRARAFAIYSFQLPVGAAIGSFIGGWGREYLGWHTTLVLVGIPGLLLALLVYKYMPEPTRGYWQANDEPQKTATFGETVRFLIQLPAFRHTVIAYSVWVTAVAASSFDVVFLERSFGLKPSSIGTLVGIAGMLAMTGYFFAGWIADRLAARNSPWAPRLPAVFLLLHLGVALIYYNATSVQTVMILVVTAPLIPATLPLVMNNIQSLAPPHMRAQAAALLLTTSTLIGMSIGPPFVGFLSDQFASEFGKDSMRYALMCMITVGWLWAVLHYFLASRTFARDALAKDR